MAQSLGLRNDSQVGLASLRSSWGTTLPGRGVRFARKCRLRSRIVLCERNWCQAGHGKAQGSNTFEAIKTLGSRVDGIGVSLRAIDFAFDFMGIPDGTDGLAGRARIEMGKTSAGGGTA